jgi:hypothetical protein
MLENREIDILSELPRLSEYIGRFLWPGSITAPYAASASHIGVNRENAILSSIINKALGLLGY